MKIFSNKGQWGCSFTPASYVTLRKLVNLLYPWVLFFSGGGCFWIKKTTILLQGCEEQTRSHTPSYEQEGTGQHYHPIPSPAKAAVYVIQQFTPELLKLSQVNLLRDVS